MTNVPVFTVCQVWNFYVKASCFTVLDPNLSVKGYKIEQCGFVVLERAVEVEAVVVVEFHARRNDTFLAKTAELTATLPEVPVGYLRVV